MFGNPEKRALITTRVIVAVPLILVNTVAVSGQFAYLSDHLPWPTVGVAVFAAAIESTALYLAYMAHKALISLDSSLRLRLGAQAFGLLAGFMNATHYKSHGHFTFVSIATGIMSASSPMLWGIYSRRMSRDILMEKRLIESGAVRLGVNRWLWHFGKSFGAYRLAAWEGTREPGAAISAYMDAREAKRAADIAPEPEPEPDKPAAIIPAELPVIDAPARVKPAAIEAPAATDTADSDAPGATVALGVAIDDALAALPESATAPDVVAYLAARGVTVTAGYVRQRKSRKAKGAVTARRDSVRALPGGRV